MLPDATPTAATVVVERLRGAVPGSQTASAGIACWDGEETADELVARADRALYQAKERGRDGVSIDDRRARAAWTGTVPAGAGDALAVAGSSRPPVARRRGV